jgi:hypothetical protein
MASWLPLELYLRVRTPPRAASVTGFQEQMASVVLVGLIYHICEMYLDDCIVFATGHDQFLERLEIIFKRFKDKNTFLKASKCKFGLPIVEYVGCTISKEGTSMSTKKIKLSFRLSKTKR